MTHDFTAKKSLAPTSISGTFNETKNLLLQRFTLKEIAKRRNITEGTVLSHIEKIASVDKAIDLDYLVQDQQKQQKIGEAFKKTNSKALSPAFNHLKGKYSYEELRLARIMMNR